MKIFKTHPNQIFTPSKIILPENRLNDRDIQQLNNIRILKKIIRQTAFFVFLIFSFTAVKAQMITGVWKGRISRQKAELKIVLNGDSLTGTAYYFESANNYRRYSIKGYFDQLTNSAVWWDDQLIEERSTRFSLSSPGRVPMLSIADFNCPGDGRMMLDGTSTKKDENDKPEGDLHLDKVNTPEFADEWDFVIDNYLVGGNDPDVIDSIARLSNKPVIPEREKIIRETGVAVKELPVVEKNEVPVINTKPTVIVTAPRTKTPDPLPGIEEKFVQRKKILVTEIPVSGDSIELRFYDNAEIDGDSISLFLNEKLIFRHIRLTGNAYIIKLPVTELADINELIMVAENLGSIPPNTSYMVALVGDKRYEARLESTEGSSAMVRFVKK